jgi:hypothetical protein
MDSITRKFYTLVVVAKDLLSQSVKSQPPRNYIRTIPAIRYGTTDGDGKRPLLSMIVDESDPTRKKTTTTSPTSPSNNTSRSNHHRASSSPTSPSHPSPSSTAPSMMMDASESVLRFLLLPHQIYVILLLEFLNSFRGFGLRFVLYNYITNEFGFGDSQAGTLLGIKGFVDIGE